MTLAQRSAGFIDFVENWLATRPIRSLADVIHDPARTALLSVDIINGFCTLGPLASPRVQGIVAPIAALMSRAYDLGARHFVLTQDTHDPQAVEFAQYPPHCIRGTPESDTVPELKALAFAERFVIFPKNSISSSEATGLDAWLDSHPEVNTFIAVGDCSDLCTYQLAMHLRLRANARQLADVRVIVPADCVQTYDTPLPVAAELNIPPHAADLLHAIFLFNMATNGVDVVAGLR